MNPKLEILRSATKSTADTLPCKLTPRNLIICGGLAIALAASSAFGQAERYPNRPVKLVVPFEPGGSTDSTARYLAQKLGEKLGQSFVVENRGGAGGNIGTDLVAKAKPDGYTLLWANVAPVAINPHLYKKIPYDSVKDFAPITLATVFPNVIVVKASLPVTSANFLEKARGELKGMSYGSAGNGSSTHLAAEWLNTSLQAQWLHVPFKGGGPALLAVAAGQVDFYVSSIPAALPMLKNGLVKAIATTGKQRDPALQNVPTIAELGLHNYEVINWNGLLAPANTPKGVIEALNKATVEILSSPEAKAGLREQGAEPAPMTTEAFTDYLRSESAKWVKIIKMANAKVD
ncbi:Bug family tripartite tricarboxylate transporter substrate binding protein [Ottowia thiooxydans]|uniref:Bug family tripartite tricarboxylate transporter substrate binding protein n=1 Tax=Ottowia thiooxydans TaxID=219182 RepID=UPI0006870769|nr:tripartite tricarboxylate transporter substrate binding protein [Ottowia thiooxydans]